jgi:head-tail adaptor
MVDLGPLDQLVRIEYQGTVNDPDYGNQPGAWVPLATVWANVQDVLPSAGDRGESVRVSDAPARVRMRYRSDVTASMRLVLLHRGDRVLRIVGRPAELGRRQGLELLGAEFKPMGDAP